MHQYLKSIGFGNIQNKKELHKILHQVEKSYTQHNLMTLDEETDLCEYAKEFGAGIGIILCGDMDLSERFTPGYYIPFFVGTGITSYADVYVERRIDREAYVGICEDLKIGISLIFHLQNMTEYLREKQMSRNSVKYTSITLSGLSNGGTILLPVLKSKEQEKKQQEDVRNRMMLMSAAKSGDQAAIDSLTLYDIDTYSEVSRRLITEDVFSIVDTYIMPYGVECDRYSIMGEIQEFQQMENEYTQEELYIMKLEVNGLTFDICVPVKEVMGEPAVGRRFKGEVWMQGRINF